MKLLIIYGTKEGQTRKICDFLCEEARKRDHWTELSDSMDRPLTPCDFDAVIVAAPVHMGKYHSSVVSYVRKHHEALNKIPTAFLSVSLAAGGDDPGTWEELNQITHDFLYKTGWHPEHLEYVAGALRYSKYNFLKKVLMRMIAAKNGGDTDTSIDYEYTDWDQVRQVLNRLEKTLSPSETNQQPTM